MRTRIELYWARNSRNGSADIILINDNSPINDVRLNFLTTIFTPPTRRTQDTTGQQQQLGKPLTTDSVTTLRPTGPITIGTDYIPPNSPYRHHIDATLYKY